MKRLEDKKRTKDESVDELLSRIMKESPSTLSRIKRLRKYFDPFYQRQERLKNKTFHSLD